MFPVPWNELKSVQVLLGNVLNLTCLAMTAAATPTIFFNTASDPTTGIAWVTNLDLCWPAGLTRTESLMPHKQSQPQNFFLDSTIRTYN